MQAVIVGECDPKLRTLLEEVLDDIGIDLGPQADVQSPGVVLTFLTRDDPTGAVAMSRLVEGRPPIVALSAMSDELLAARAIAAGACACYSLDTPISRLQAILRALVAEGLAPGRPRR